MKVLKLYLFTGTLGLVCGTGGFFASMYVLNWGPLAGLVIAFAAYFSVAIPVIEKTQWFDEELISKEEPK